MRHDVERIRGVMHVRWDAARHRRVFASALHSSAQREEHSRVVRWLALATVALVVVRALPRSTTPGMTDSRPAPSIDDRERQRGEGGLAGTRGASRGARGNGGTGGGAGTG